MDSSNIKPDLDRLVKGLTSLEVSEFEGVINEFFQPDVLIDSSVLKVKGVNSVKKFTALQALVADGNELVGKPSYDEKSQVVDFDFKRTYKYPPILPSLPIISSYFAGQKNWYKCHAQLKLQPFDGQDGKNGKSSQRLFVSQVGVKEPPQPPAINFVLYHGLRPLLSIVSGVLSFFASFYYRHIKDTWVQFFFAAVNELFQGVWSILLSGEKQGSAQMDKWRKAKGEDLSKMIESAKSTAGKAQNEIETRAKKAGVPVDDYKKRAEPVVGEVQKEVVGTASYFDTKQEEVKKQVKETVNGNNSSGGGKSDNKESKSSGKSKSKSSGKSDNKNDSKSKKGTGLMDDVPQTPLGGHDPTANNAPSFAKAAEAAANSQSKSDNSQSKSTNSKSKSDDSQGKTDMDDVPQTPLGGHDPTASNAPSYAQAANE